MVSDTVGVLYVLSTMEDDHQQHDSIFGLLQMDDAE